MRRLLIISLSAVIAVAFAISWVLNRDESQERQRYDRGETELVVANLSHSTVTLFKAGRTQDEARTITDFDGSRIWLPAGNYFVQSEEGNRKSFFPIPLTGYRCGPDEQGSYLVTIRPLPGQFPPTLFPALTEFVYIPSGTFLIGDRQNPRERHYVWVAGYFIAPFEVTNGEFRLFLRARDGYGDDANWTEEGRRWRASGRSHVSALLDSSSDDYARFGQGDLPVTWVNWFEAAAFCKWLSRRNPGWLYALPTDAEWEKAARGPDNFDYALSMFISDAEEPLYNWRKNPDAPLPLYGVTSTTRNFRPNRFGIYHLTGNVVEWSQSIDRPFNKDYPFANDDRNHENVQGKRTARGGSWYSAATSYLYIPYRDSFQPEHSSQDVGFRIIARALP